MKNEKWKGNKFVKEISVFLATGHKKNKKNNNYRKKK